MMHKAMEHIAEAAGNDPAFHLCEMLNTLGSHAAVAYACNVSESTVSGWTRAYGLSRNGVHYDVPTAERNVEVLLTAMREGRDVRRIADLLDKSDWQIFVVLSVLDVHRWPTYRVR